MKMTQFQSSELSPREIIDQQFAGDEEAYIQSLVGKFKDERDKQEEKTEYLKRLKEFARWRAMLRRCWDTKSDSYKYYGGRGVKVCERWLQFENFFADMGVAPEGCSLDRIDPNGNYEPSNCRWATAKEQATNKRIPPKPKVFKEGTPKPYGVGSVCLINGRWRALVRIMGVSKSKYFADRDLAVEWAAETSASLRSQCGQLRTDR